MFGSTGRQYRRKRRQQANFCCLGSLGGWKKAEQRGQRTEEGLRIQSLGLCELMAGRAMPVGNLGCAFREILCLILLAGISHRQRPCQIINLPSEISKRIKNQLAISKANPIEPVQTLKKYRYWIWIFKMFKNMR